MWQRAILSVCSLLFVLPSSAVLAQRYSLLVPTGVARRYGMERAWFTQVQLDRARGRLHQLTPHVSSTQSTIVYEVVRATGKDVITEKGFDRFGSPLGDFGAQETAIKKLRSVIDELKESKSKDVDQAKLAETEAIVKQVLDEIDDARDKNDEAAPDEKIDLNTLAPSEPLLKRGVDSPDVLPKLVKRIIPDVTVYALTDSGTMHAIDGETGDTKWSVKVGNPRYPNMGPAARDDIVAMVNGSTLYVIDAIEGKLLWSRSIRGAPGAGPALSDTKVFVPTIGGMMESISTLDEREFPYQYKSHGRSLVQPVITESSIIWPTDIGHLYVANANRPGVRYRLETNGIAGRATFQRGRVNRILAATVDGYLYCLHETSGSVFWRFSTGETVSHEPIVMNDGAYIITEEGGMYRVDLENGAEQWRAQGIRGYVAASKDRLYCLGLSGRVLIVDPTSGATLAALPTEQLDYSVVNTVTDRIYIGTRTGLIQCLHESRHDWPLLHSGEVVVKKEKKPDVIQTEIGEPMAEPMENPFGGGAKNPFGGGAKNPFGGGGAAADDKKDDDDGDKDVFGGDGKNPFSFDN